MSASDIDVLVIGAGAAGLAAAHTLQQAGLQPQVVDARSEAGGVIGTTRVAGHAVERGPNSLRVTPAARRFLERCGADTLLEKATPASRRRWLLHSGSLVEVPSTPMALVRTPLLSARAKRRVLAEPFVRRGDAGQESVSDFIARRLGPEVASALVGPFLTGVYAGDEGQLGAEAAFPSLVGFERTHGSILAGALASALRRRPREERGLPGSYSARGGLGSLAYQLGAGLGDLRLGTRVGDLVEDGVRWRVDLTGPTGESTLSASALVLAVPAREASQLLRPCVEEAAEGLAGIEYAPIVTIGMSADPRDLGSPVNGFGFLVPRAAALGLLGCLFMSEIFSGRAPEGRVLLHCLLGGVRWPEAPELPDDLLVERTCEGLDRTLGISQAPDCLAITRWPRAVPQPGVDHLQRVKAIRAALARHATLEIAGSHLDGVSVADTLASGVAAAERLLVRRCERR